MDYEIFRKDRGRDEHGGVILAVKPSINPPTEINDTDHEVAVVNLMIRSKALKIINVYRCQSINAIENESLISFLYSKILNHRNVFMIGDFKLPNINWVNETTDLINKNKILNMFHAASFLSYEGKQYS